MHLTHLQQVLTAKNNPIVMTCTKMQCNALSPQYGNQQNNSLPSENPRSAHQLNTTLKPFQNLEMKEFGLELPSLINSHIFWRSYILHRIHNTLHPISSSDISPLNLLFLISEEKWTCIGACHVPSFAEAKIGDWFVN